MLKKVSKMFSDKTIKIYRFIDFHIYVNTPFSCRIRDEKFCYDPNNIVVIKAGNGFGDNLMASAVIKGIHLQYPTLRIIVLARHSEIFKNNPYVFRIYGLRDIPILVRLRMRIIWLKYKCPNRKQRKNNDKPHFIDSMYDCLPFRILSRCYEPCIFFSERELSYRKEELKQLPRPLVAISPYGKKDRYLQSKVYPYDKWQLFVKLLRKAGINIIQIGLSSEGPLLDGTLDYRDLGYRDTAVVLSYCDVVITHGGGIMHLATAVKTSCLVIYGGIEDPVVSGYERNKNICVKLDCAPCWRKKLCLESKCLKMISPEIIAKETFNMIKEDSKT